MTRSASTLDRLAALVFGLALIALGVGLLVWNTDWITGIPQIITAPGLVTAAETGWWPWAVAAAGIVLVAIALRWLFTHTPKAKIKNLRLSGGNAGSISVDLGEVADAAARVLATEHASTFSQGQSNHRPRYPHHRSHRDRALTDNAECTDRIDRFGEHADRWHARRPHHRHPNLDPHRQAPPPRPRRVDGARTRVRGQLEGIGTRDPSPETRGYAITHGDQSTLRSR